MDREWTALDWSRLQSSPVCGSVGIEVISDWGGPRFGLKRQKDRTEPDFKTLIIIASIGFVIVAGVGFVPSVSDKIRVTMPNRSMTTEMYSLVIDPGIPCLF